MSEFWFAKTPHICENHLLTSDFAAIAKRVDPSLQSAAELLARRGDVKAVDEDKGYRAHSEQTDENERAESGDRLTARRF